MRRLRFIFSISIFFSLLFVVSNLLLTPALAIYTEEDKESKSQERGISPSSKDPIFLSTPYDSAMPKGGKGKTLELKTPKIKGEIPRYVPGEIIIKFKKAAGPLIDKKISTNTLKLAPRSTGLATVDKLNTKNRVIEVVSAFPVLKKQQLKSKQPSPAPSQAVPATLSRRAGRVPPHAVIPNLSDIYKLKLADRNADILAICQEYKEKVPEVEYCEPNYLATVQLLPNDFYVNQDGSWRTGSWTQGYPDMWGLKRIKMEPVWDITSGSSEIIVAVSDTGVDYNHPDIAQNIFTNPNDPVGDVPDNCDRVAHPEIALADDDCNGYIDDFHGYDLTTCSQWNITGSCLAIKSPDNDPKDDHGHGTHVAGTIAAITNNSIGAASISSNSKILSVKGMNYQGMGSYVDLANTIKYAADNGADIINMSWGGYGYSQIIADAINYAYAKGVIPVVAAGNSNSEVANFIPAGLPHVISVAAWSFTDERASFSNFGDLIDVTAPGVEILSLRAEGTDMYCQFGSCNTHIVGTNYYRASGTSMAAPHVSGVVALLLSLSSYLNPDLVELVIQMSAEDVLTLGKDKETGYGLLDAQAALALVTQNFTIPLPELFVRSSSAIFQPLLNQLSIHAEIANIGFLEASNVPYTIYSGDPQQGGILLDTGTISGRPISPGESALLDKVVPASINNAPAFITIQIDPSATIGEYFKTNNQQRVLVKLANLPGWPKMVGEGQFINSSPLVADLDPVYPGLEVVVGASKGKVYAWHADGTPVSGWPQPTGGMIIYCLSIADIDGDDDFEVIAGIDGAGGGKVYAWHADGTLVSGWPQITRGSVYSAPAIADLDPTYPGLEIVVGDYFDSLTESNGDIYAWHADGTPVSGWPKNRTAKVFSSAVIADLDPAYPGLEIVVAHLLNGAVYAWHADGTPVPHWPQSCGGWLYSSPSIADLDPAYPGLEVMVGTTEGSAVFAWHADGTPVPNWPQYIDMLAPAAPSIADLDPVYPGLEVVVEGTRKVYAWHADGTPVPHWPQSFGYMKGLGKDPSLVSLAIVDIDGDGDLEVIKGSTDTNVYVWHTDGTSIPWGMQSNSRMISSPVIADLDGNGTLEVVAADIDGWVYTWTLPWVSNQEPAPWPAYKHDLRKTGNFNFGKPPELTPIGYKTINEGEPLTFTVSANDADSDFLIYSTGASPNGATFDGNTHIFSWTPTFKQAGSYSITFMVSDGASIDQEIIQIAVEDVNHPPELDPIGDRQVNEGSPLTFTVTANDLEKDDLTYSASPLPFGASFDASTQTFSWRPGFTQAEQYSITFTVSDGKLSDQETIVITVSNVNGPPELTAIGGKTINEGESLTFTIYATDPDSNALTYSASNIPSGASFNTETHTFSWIPNYFQAGIYPNVHFEVSDGNLNTSEDITITVNNANAPPVFAAIGDKSLFTLKTLSFKVSATDPEGEKEKKLVYSVSPLPAGATFVPKTRSFRWRPTIVQRGQHQITFYATDSQGATGSQTITISVLNSPPKLGLILNKSVSVGRKLTFTIRASDHDRDTLTFSVDNLPNGATFDASTGKFIWIPASNQIGNYTLRFSVSDGHGGSDAKDMKITVKTR